MLKPLGDRVLLRSLATPGEKTQNGIVIPESAVPTDRTAEVLAVGPQVSELDVQPGDVVLFAQFAGLDAGVPGIPDQLVMSVKNLIAVLA